MSRDVTIVMYHYVRDLKRSRYPEIKGLDAADFLGQMDYILKHYEPVRMEDVIQATRDKSFELPNQAILLTFDDGYIDHFDTVFPVLDRLGIQGSFYPPGRAIIEHKVLDVNKIHFILASVENKTRLVKALEKAIDDNRIEYGLKSLRYYRAEFARANKWDPAETIYIKRVLQRGLPETLRHSLIDRMFKQFVTNDETAFAQELYTSTEQLKCMLRHGMHIGSHSYDHYWLDSLPPDQQSDQIEKSTCFLESLGCEMDNWTMCYPHGGYDSSALRILNTHKCALALTCDVAIANTDESHRLEMPRIDTTDLPYGEKAV